MVKERRTRILDLISENWGFFFILYGFILFILTIISYMDLIKISITELSFYMSVSLAVGVTLQLLSSFITIRRGAPGGGSLLSRLLYANIGIFFYGYSSLLLWCSLLFYLMGDVTQHLVFLEYGGISALAGILLHSISKTISSGRTSWIPHIIALMIASISSALLFHNFLLPAKLNSMLKVTFAFTYFMSVPLSYYLCLKLSESIFSSIYATLLVATTPLFKSMIMNQNLSALIFSTTYLCFILLIFYFKGRDIAVALSGVAAALQAYFSKAFPLTILLFSLGVIVEKIGEKYRRYVTYLAFSIALIALSYLLLWRLDLILEILRTFNFYLTASLTLSACLSMILLMKRSVEDSSRISVAFIPLMVGLFTYFNESATALICLASVLASLSIIYLPKSISVNRIDEEAVEVVIELEKLLISLPAIALLLLSINEWL